MSRRIPCVVPDCGCTRAVPPGFEVSEFICREHWRLLPRRQRRIWGRLAGGWRRFGPIRVAGLGEERSAGLLRAWRGIRRAAIESAAGVG